MDQSDKLVIVEKILELDEAVKDAIEEEREKP